MKDTGMTITGAGAISSLGTGKEMLFSYLKTGAMDAEKAAVGAPIPPGRLTAHFDVPEPRLKIMRYMDPTAKNIIVALGGALADAALTPEDITADPYGYGMVLGTVRGPCLTRDALYGSLASRKGRLVSGTLFSHCGYNIAGAAAAIAFGMKGPNITLAAAGDLGALILKRAQRLLAGGRVHTVCAGFSECPEATPEAGCVGHEAACILCLERADHARSRGVRHPPGIHELEAADESFSDRTWRAWGYHGKEETSAADRTPDRIPLPGLGTPFDRFASILVLGLLGCDEQMSGNYPVAGFASGAGETRTLHRIVYGDTGEANR